MIKIIFKDLEKSELAREATEERLLSVTDRFPNLKGERITLTLSMQNSPTQAGPDRFSVKFHCRSGRYKGVILERSAPSLYKALADLEESLLERLNRFGDKERVKHVKQARKMQRAAATYF